MYFTFVHSYGDIEFAVECDYTPEVEGRIGGRPENCYPTEPAFAEWYVKGFKNVREIVEAESRDSVNMTDIREEVDNLEADIEGECYRRAKQILRETEIDNDYIHDRYCEQLEREGKDYWGN